MLNQIDINNLWGEIKIGEIIHSTGLPIQQVILYNNFLYTLGYNENYEKVDSNLFCFSNSGQIIWRNKKLRIEYPIGSGQFGEYIPNFMTIKSGYLYVLYPIGYELTLNLETGVIMNEKFENRRF